MYANKYFFHHWYFGDSQSISVRSHLGQVPWRAQVFKDNLKREGEVSVYFCIFHQISLLYFVFTVNV